MQADVDSIQRHPTTLLWRVLAIAFSLATVLAVMGASQSHAYYAVNGGTPPPWSQSLLWSAAQWYACAAFVPFVALLGMRFSFSDGARLPGRVALHIVFALGFAFAHLLLQTMIIWFVLPGGRAFLGGFGTGMLTLLATSLQWELLSYAVVLAAVHVAVYLRRAQTEALARREAQTQTALAQLDALKRQMQPHFLFNALNALVSMQAEDSPEQRFTLRLAETLRPLFESGQRASAVLADELRLVDAYLHIERVRLGTRLRTTIAVPESLHGTVLPSLILQPLVENAVTHGVSTDPQGGEVSLQAYRDGAQIVVEVVNTWRHVASTQDRSCNNGVALDNCRRRLALMYGESARLETRALPNESFRAAIILPTAAAVGDAA
jgi:two-component system LytT family sensor kinase